MAESAANSRRGFAKAAKPTTLASAIDNVTQTITLIDGSTYPDGTTSGPFMLTLDSGLSSEERVEVPSRSGNVCTSCVRGADGTTPQAHGTTVNGVIHSSTGRDFDEANKVVSDVNKWTSFSPTIGDLGSMTASITADARDYYRYLRVGKLCWVQFNQIITIGGTRQAAYSVLLPVAAAHAHNVFACTIENVAGHADTSDFTDRVLLSRYDAATLAAGATHHTFSGVYEIA